MRNHHQTYKLKHSQNFIRSEKTAKDIVSRMSLTPQDIVVEIGPGKGELTKHLLPHVALLIGVEKDTQMAQNLPRHMNNDPKLLCFQADFLNWGLPFSDFKLIGNIPFAHTAEIIRKLTRHQSPPQVSYLIMQKEAGLKYTGTPHESVFSIKLKLLFDVKILMSIPRNQFRPVPSVDAVLLAIYKKDKPTLPVEQQDRFIRFIEQIFFGYQDSAKKALRKFLSTKQIERLESLLKIDLNTRRTSISFEQWVKIFTVVDCR